MKRTKPLINLDKYWKLEEYIFPLQHFLFVYNLNKSSYVSGNCFQVFNKFRKVNSIIFLRVCVDEIIQNYKKKLNSENFKYFNLNFLFE